LAKFAAIRWASLVSSFAARLSVETKAGDERLTFFESNLWSLCDSDGKISSADHLQSRRDSKRRRTHRKAMFLLEVSGCPIFQSRRASSLLSSLAT